MKDIFKDKKFIMLFILIIFIFIFILLFSNKKTNIYYRDINSRKYAKNGAILENNNGFNGIGFKINNHSFSYQFYTNKWNDINDASVNNKYKNKIYGIRLSLDSNLSKEYDICYRTYNKKDKWLKWTCDYEINGDINYKITKLQVKLIKKDSLRSENLPGYNTNSDYGSIGF